MQTEVLIIGQGLCGTWLSWYLQQAGVGHIMIDEQKSGTPSRSAAGLINPVTGRRIVKTWMIDELLPFVQDAYRQLGESLNADLISEKTLIDFFPTAQMRLAFLNRYEEDTQYLALPGKDDDKDHVLHPHDWDHLFQYELGFGMVQPCYWVNLPDMLNATRKSLKDKGILHEGHFDLKELVVEGTGPVKYKGFTADRVVFCDGIESYNNPYFAQLPFAPNKGEALIIDIPDLRTAEEKVARPMANEYVFKKGISLIPWKEGYYWVGSSYEWNFEHTDPTEAFRKSTETNLRNWLKLPFEVVGHFASVRPATLERRPFVGFHPTATNVGILNGMGTKGCSLAPWFAKQLAELIVNGTAVQPDADVRRFSGVLKRG